MSSNSRKVNAFFCCNLREKMRSLTFHFYLALYWKECIPVCLDQVLYAHIHAIRKYMHAILEVFCMDQTNHAITVHLLLLLTENPHQH